MRPTIGRRQELLLSLYAGVEASALGKYGNLDGSKERSPRPLGLESQMVAAASALAWRKIQPESLNPFGLEAWRTGTR